MEIWKDVSGFEGYYQVSNEGRVRSLDRIVEYSDGRRVFYPGRMITPVRDKDGYLQVGLRKPGQRKAIRKVHRLVAEHFLLKPPGCDVVNNLNSVITDNRAANLEWTTVRGNALHAIMHGNGQIGSRHSRAILNETDVREIKRLLRRGNLKQREIAEMFGVSPKTITNIATGHRWKHVI